MNFLQAVCLAALLCGVAWSAAPFSAQISVQPEYDIGSDVICSIIITNFEDQDYHLLRRNTPLEGLKTSLFSIGHNGTGIPYDGLFFRRGVPSKEEYVLIAAKSSLVSHLDLTQVYSLSRLGNYTVELKSMFQFFKDNPANSTRQYVSSNIAKFTLLESGNAPKLTKAEVLRRNATNSLDLLSTVSTPRRPSFGGRRTSRDESISITAYNAAYNTLYRSYQSVTSNPSLYTRWFGIRYNSYMNTVKRVYRDMKSAMEVHTFTLYFNGLECDPDTYAYTYPGGRTLYLCGAYMSAPTTGVNSKMDTLVHEMSHAVSYTDDIEYGMERCLWLASNSPYQAINNADNYAYFADYQ